MANLLDTIRQNRGVQEQPQMTDESQRVAGLLRARSGRAVSSPDVAASSLQEQATIDATAGQLQNVNQADAFVQQGLAQQQREIQQKETSALRDVAQARRFDDLQTRIKTDQLLNDLERDKGKVNLNEDRAKMEQVGFNLRLQNNQYIDSLQREGARARLDNELAFKEELQREVFGDNEQLLKDRYEDNNILNASDRDFRRAMADMNIKTAWDMFDNEMKALKKQARWNMLTGGVTSGLGGASQMGPSESSETLKSTDASPGGYGTGTRGVDPTIQNRV